MSTETSTLPDQAQAAPARSQRLLARLGLDRPELRAWAMYDWANSAMVTTIMAAVFPIYYVSVVWHGLPVAAAEGRLGLCNGVAKFIPAVLSPILGAIADRYSNRKTMLGTCVGLGVAAVFGMWFIQAGDIALASILFVISSIAVSLSFVFYESMLPHIASDEEMARVSTAGYALGYVGGGLLLAINLLWIWKPGWFGIPNAAVAMRLSFVSVGIWWLLFSIPLFRRVPEPRIAKGVSSGNPLTAPFSMVRHTLRELRTQHRPTLLMIVAFFIYNDGIVTIYTMAVAYGKGMGFSPGVLIAALLLVQFVGIPFAFAFGFLADRIGAKRAVLLGLAVYVALTVYGLFMKTETDFIILAFGVAMVQGGTQALSRSIFARMVPRQKSGEYFGFFSVFNRFGGVIGTMMFWVMAAATGTSRYAILAVVTLFVLGGILLAFVNIAQGERLARQASDSPAD